MVRVRYLFRWLVTILISSALVFIILSHRTPLLVKDVPWSSAASWHPASPVVGVDVELCGHPNEAESDLSTLSLAKATDGTAEMSKITANLNSRKSDKSGKLRVFVVPHSHIDPGWLLTFHGYFEQTNLTMDLAVDFMSRHPKMTFQWMEMSFLEQWWATSNSSQREKLKKLVKEKQFDLLTGAWTMTDEAVPYFWASIDNLIEGHRFVYNNFGIIPNVSWSNDPFGYGPTMPYILQKSGISQFVIGRVHAGTKDILRQGHNLEFVWRQSWDGNGVFDSAIHSLPYSHYDIPNSCGPDPSTCCQFDFRRLKQYQCGGPKPEVITQDNVAAKAKQILGQLRLSAGNYKHNNILFMLGDDFRYRDPVEWIDQYENFQVLMEHINSDAGKGLDAEMKFSTITEYFNSLPPDLWSQKRSVSVTGDFFPYTDNRYDFWSGYYSSRAFHKRLDRILQSHLRAADIFSSLAVASTKLSKSDREALSNEVFESLTKARRDLALFQHHDAITGTSKALVMADYALRLNKALIAVEYVLSRATVVLTSQAGSMTLDDIHNKAKDLQPPDQPYNYKTPEETISIGAGEEKVVSILNPLPSDREEVIRLRTNNAYVKVSLSDGTTLEVQIQPAIDFNTKIEDGLFEIVFILPQKPLSITVLHLTAQPKKVSSTKFVDWESSIVVAQQGLIPMKKIDDTKNIEIKHEYQTAIFDAKTGLLQEITKSETTSKCVVQFSAYHSASGGAYIFRANKTPQPYSKDKAEAVHVIRGQFISEVHTLFSGIWHRATLVHSTIEPIANVIHIRNTVFMPKSTNFELVLQVESNIKSGDTFWTDSMGYQIFQRHYQKSKGAEQNYYPISTAIYVEDDQNRITLLTAQPHGGMMHRPGGVEVMLDRTLLQDDYRGMGEPVQDNVPVTSDFKLVMQKMDQAAKSHTESLSGYHAPSTIGEMRDLLNPPVILQYSSTPTQGSLSSYVPSLTPLPVTYDLLALRPIDSGLGPLLMIVHRRGSTCDVCSQSNEKCSTLANSSMSTIPHLINLLSVESAVETSLTGIYDQSPVPINPFSLRDIQPMDMVSYKLFRKGFQQPTA